VPQKIGIVGGLSPESTVTYYSYLTRKYSEIFGGSTFPEIVIYSVNLEKYHKLRNEDRWDLIADDLVKAIKYLESCDVDVALISTNTMHKVFLEVQSRTSVKLISIIGSTIESIKKNNIKTVGLLGTRFTMTDDFFTKELLQNDIASLVPNQEEVIMIHRIIEEELVKGIFQDSSRSEYLRVINRLVGLGAEGIILGCTEIPLLIKQKDVGVLVFDTATIHSEATLQYILKKDGFLTS
jgi:aspartate racemase